MSPSSTTRTLFLSRWVFPLLSSFSLPCPIATSLPKVDVTFSFRRSIHLQSTAKQWFTKFTMPYWANLMWDKVFEEMHKLYEMCDVQTQCSSMEATPKAWEQKSSSILTTTHRELSFLQLSLAFTSNNLLCFFCEHHVWLVLLLAKKASIPFLILKAKSWHTCVAWVVCVCRSNMEAETCTTAGSTMAKRLQKLHQVSVLWSQLARESRQSSGSKEILMKPHGRQLHLLVSSSSCAAWFTSAFVWRPNPKLGSCSLKAAKAMTD